ncbi:unnamed protein product [Meganyctiphanes norvegica]|uniref:Uncharacterized protein n=1 Tax=Meganyctiphanes norvegica TaxID=48144 RepID=A0AAV2R1F9_MEGNR
MSLRYIMDEQSSLIEKHLLELLDKSTTPEKALQSLLSPCFSSVDVCSMDYEPVLIFLAYMRFIMTRQPEAYVDSIWEKILRKTMMFSRNCSDSGEEITHVMKTHTNVLPEDGPQVLTWLQKALVVHKKCPNPYLRLDLFRLIRIFRWNTSGNMSTKDRANLDDTYERVCSTFIHTIGEIQPLHLYPSGSEEKVLFSLADLSFIFDHYECNLNQKLQKIISNGIIEELMKHNTIDVESKEGKFISNCIQLIGIFMVKCGSISKLRMTSIRDIDFILNFFKYQIGNLIYYKDFEFLLPGNIPWEQFRYILSHPSFRPHIMETICYLTSAIINNPCKYSTQLWPVRDCIAGDLGVCTKTSDLPKLLLSRQVHGPGHVHTHTLLLPDLRHMKPNDFYMRMADIIDMDDEDMDSQDCDVEFDDSEDGDAEFSDAEDN